MSVRLRGSVSQGLFQAIERAAAQSGRSRTKFLKAVVGDGSTTGTEPLFKVVHGRKPLTLTISNRMFVQLTDHMHANGLSKGELLLDLLSRSSAIHGAL